MKLSLQLSKTLRKGSSDIIRKTRESLLDFAFTSSCDDDLFRLMSNLKIFLFLVMYSYNINWNYGLLPQTWEDPTQANSEVEGAFGDNDPGM